MSTNRFGAFTQFPPYRFCSDYFFITLKLNCHCNENTKLGIYGCNCIHHADKTQYNRLKCYIMYSKAVWIRRNYLEGRGNGGNHNQNNTKTCARIIVSLAAKTVSRRPRVWSAVLCVLKSRKSRLCLIIVVVFAYARCCWFVNLGIIDKCSTKIRSV